MAFAEMRERINRDVRRSTVASAIGVITIPTMALRSPVPPDPPGGVPRVVPLSLAMQTTTRIPLGAGMDYRVFLTSRRREELGLNLRFVEGWIRTMERAGPGVLFSGLASAIGYCRPAAPGSC